MMSIAIAQRIRSSLPIVQRCLGSQSSLSQMNFSTNAPAKKDNIKQKFEMDVEQIILADNKEEFVSFLRTHFENLGKSSCLTTQSKLLQLVCLHRAVGCATSMLNGETGLNVDLNAELEGGLLPLQLAAQSLSFDLTTTLLEHGAQVNVSDIYGSNNLTTLPLSLALKALSRDQYLSDWTPHKSIFKLIYLFCLKDLKEALDTIKLLAEKTEDVEKVSLHCVEEGDTIQLAALLMVAWDKLVPPSIEHAEESVIGQRIWRQVDLLNNEESRYLITYGPKCEVLENLKSMKINLLMSWKVLRILEIARGVIEEYRHGWRVKTIPNSEVPYDIAYQLYWEANMILTPDDVFSDDIECLRPVMLKPEEKAKLNEEINNHLLKMSMLPKLHTQDEAWSTDFLGKMRQSESMFTTYTLEKPSGCCSKGSSMCFTQSRSYHSCSALNINYGKSIRSVRVHQEARPSFSIFLPPTQICARLFLTAKRYLK